MTGVVYFRVELCACVLRGAHKCYTQRVYPIRSVYFRACAKTYSMFGFLMSTMSKLNSVFLLSRTLHCSARVLKKVKAAEHRWLQRQRRDPYVKASYNQNFRCRSAFKLLEIDDKFRLLLPGHAVVDCGAAPGAWSQVAVQRVNSTGIDPSAPRGTVVGVDVLNIAALDGAQFLSHHDVTDPATHSKLQQLLPKGCAHVLLSDMAPNASGFRELDCEKLISMCLTLIDLAEKVLLPGGSLLCKYWEGPFSQSLEEKLSCVFGNVRTVKPNASRKDSSEKYFLARMYRKPIK